MWCALPGRLAVPKRAHAERTMQDARGVDAIRYCERELETW